jgi:hypothetical protein
MHYTPDSLAVVGVTWGANLGKFWDDIGGWFCCDITLEVSFVFNELGVDLNEGLLLFNFGDLAGRLGGRGWVKRVVRSAAARTSGPKNR